LESALLKASSCSVREAKPEDAGFLFQIQSSCPDAAQWPKKDIAEACAGKWHMGCLVATRFPSGELAGFLLFRTVGQEMEILNVAVLPDFRRERIASNLWNSALEIAKRRGITRAYLEVRESNHIAQKFYLRHGFSVSGRRSNYYDNPREDALIMEMESPAG
jgi:ribosomal-protein-alanine N-acetyltransferase